MEKEITNRKLLLRKAMAQNFAVYNQINQKQPLKAIIIFIDNYDMVREFSFDVENFITKISRDGVSLGIFTIITATRLNAIRYATLNNFKNRIILYLNDNAEMNSIIGKSKYTLSDTKGRALVKTQNINIMQTYLPLPFINDIDFSNSLLKYVLKLKKLYKGEAVNSIPVLPDIFYFNDFNLFEYEKADIFLGLQVNEVKMVGINKRQSPFLIIGPKLSGKSNLLEIILNQVKGKGKVFIFDSKDMYLNHYKNEKDINYAYTKTQTQKMINELDAIIKHRKALFEEAVNNNLYLKDFFLTMPSICLLIDDIDLLNDMFSNENNIEEILLSLCEVGVMIIASVQSNKCKGYDPVSKFFRNSAQGMVLGNQGTNPVFHVSSMKDVPQFGYGLLFSNDQYQGVKLAKFKE